MLMPAEMNEVDFAQCLVNMGKYAPAELVQQLQEVDPGDQEQVLARELPDEGLDVQPVHHAVQQLAKASGKEYGPELHLYGDYLCLFMHCFRQDMHVPCVLGLQPVTIANSLQGETYTVSQQFSGDVSLVGSIQAQTPVFLAMAEAYSGMKFSEVDAVAIDCVQEFMNVYSGLFTRELAAREQEAELELPRCGANVTPDGSHQLAARVFSGLGVFDVILAMDEFF